MELGLILGDVVVGTPPADHLRYLVRQAQAAQRVGVRYLTLGQHYLYHGQSWIQPVPLLARLAAEVGPEMRLVTTVLLAPLVHPVVLAEELASLDIVTEGRLIAGLGLGYRREEYASLGVDWRTRAARLDETLEIIEQMWTRDRVDHDGPHFEIHGPVHLRPWQRPRPPMWVGADGERGVRRAARRADGWVISPTKLPEDIEALVEVFQEERIAAGRGLVGAPVRHPIRRDVAFGPDRRSALDTFARATAFRYESYVANGRKGYTVPTPESLAARVLHGDVADCVAQAAELARRLPVGPLIVRAGWPGMSTDEVVAWIDGLEELVAGLVKIGDEDDE